MIKSITILDMQKLASEKGGQCLSKEYINTDSKLKWRCKKAHIWEAIPSSVKKGHWCPTCVGLKSLNIIEMQEIAELRGGICLSKKYTNAHTKLKWQCNRGHKWFASPTNVKSGNWCFKCKYENVRTISFNKARDEALRKGGRCLSKKYHFENEKLKWICEEEHMWMVAPSQIINGRWCPKCAGFKNTINDMRKIAHEHGGKCLSKGYKLGSLILLWQCELGHVWEAPPRRIKSGQWCPVCKTNIKEKITRFYLENIFNTKFPLVRPPWLKGENGKPLELDGYSKERNIAFEYQGRQHYESIEYMGGVKTFVDLKRRDLIKKQICEKKGICLLEIPYSIKIEDIYDYLLKLCEEKKLDIPLHIKPNLHFGGFHISKEFEDAKKIAKDRNGFLISKTFISSYTKLKWRCSKNHTWEARLNQIIAGSWCPYCAQRAKSTIENMNAIANKLGGKCLSAIYINNNTKLKWMCKKGHIWEALPRSVTSGHWCRTCSFLKRNKK